MIPSKQDVFGSMGTRRFGSGNLDSNIRFSKKSRRRVAPFS